jgi:hypothetical protein
MTLLAEVIESHGGAELWRQLRRFCAGVPINGALLAGKGKADALKDVVIEGNARDQFLRFAGFTAPDRRATYRPDRVTVEILDGQEKLAPWQEDGQTWRRLKVTFPSRIATPSPEQTFYFDQQGEDLSTFLEALAGSGCT